MRATAWKAADGVPWAAVLFASVVLTCDPAPAKAQKQKVAPTTLQIRPQLKIRVSIEPGGARVASVQAGPATRMKRADNPNIRGLMEQGDIITKVDGNPIKTLDDLRDGIAGGKQVTLTVWDKRSKKEVDWIVDPVTP
jgi:S1-C subfamily serine protease